MLETTALSTSVGDFDFGPLDLAVDAEVLTVLGPSGSGKTTLLSLVAGLVRPDWGSVELAGRLLDGRPPEDRNVGLVFQDGALFPHMTARENVAYSGAPDARVEALAETLEIADVLNRPAPTLSGGERQRIALARALAADPDALLLDEPLANLDAPVRRRLRSRLRDLFADLAIPVVYVTHDQQAAAALGDRIAVLRDGAVVQPGPVEAVFERPASPFVARFVGANVLPGGLAGRDGRVAIRPEHVTLDGPHEATVRTVVSEGAASRVTLALAAGPTLDAFATDPPPEGASVGVGLPDGHLVALEE